MRYREKVEGDIDTTKRSGRHEDTRLKRMKMVSTPISDPRMEWEVCDQEKTKRLQARHFRE